MSGDPMIRERSTYEAAAGQQSCGVATDDVTSRPRSVGTRVRSRARHAPGGFMSILKRLFGRIQAAGEPICASSQAVLVHASPPDACARRRGARSGSWSATCCHASSTETDSTGRDA